MASDLESLKKDVRSLQEEFKSLCDQRQAMVSLDRSKESGLIQRAEVLRRDMSNVRSLEDVIGRRIPKWYEADIPFTFGDSVANTTSVEISDGPFVCTQIQPLYFITDTDPSHFPLVSDTAGDYPNGSFATVNAAGRMYPCSAFLPTWAQMSFKNLLASTNPAAADFDYIADIFSSYEDLAGDLQRGKGWNYPEFDFSVQIQGSGRYWARNVPACAFYGSNSPLYLGTGGVVDANDRVVITAKPTIPEITTTGIVRFVLSGYEIDTDLTLSDVLGY